MKKPDDMEEHKLPREVGEKMPHNACFIKGQLQLSEPVTGLHWTQLGEAINVLIEVWAKQNGTQATGGLALACGSLDEKPTKEPFIVEGNGTVH